MKNKAVSGNNNATKISKCLKQMKSNVALYVFLLPALAYIFIFCYWPLYGVQIAFRDYNFVDGITGSRWVGMKWFEQFFQSPRSFQIIGNTLAVSLYSIVAGFPVPIIFALVLNQVGSRKYKRIIQTVTYMPHFISTVVIVGMISCFFSQNSGFINSIIEAFGGSRTYFMGLPQYFRHLYVWSGVWQGFGWGSIIYLAALTSIAPELHEAAMIDGASRLQRIWHIDIPGILPVVIILLILQSGNVMNVGFEKVYLMQNDLNSSVSEVIATYTYKIGLENQKYSYSSAIGLFNNIINFIILSIVNTVSRKVSGTSLW